MKNFKLFVTYCGLSLLVAAKTGIAQTSCDNCPPPQVVLYGIQMQVPQPPPDDSLGQYTTASSQQAFYNWLALGDAYVTVAAIANSDPEKGCMTWLDGTMAQELAANPDTTVIVHLQNYSTGDLPPSGQVAGVDYLVWSTLDSSGGQYTISVYLEDAYSRHRIAVGTQSFTNPNGAQAAAASAITQIEPVFDKIRAYQKELRNNSDQIAISAKIDIIPSKGEVNGGETVPVLFEVYDCDGGPGITPLSNRRIKIEATHGHFDVDSVETDANGNAGANFTADNVKEVANLTATYYPYYTPSHKTRGSWGDTTVNINLLPNRNWEMDVMENYFWHENIVDDEAGSYYSYNNIIYSSASVRQYLVGDLTDTSVSIDEVVGAKGYTSLGQTERTVRYGAGFYSNEVLTEDGSTAADEDFIHSIVLGYAGKSLGGITFISNLLLRLDGVIHLYDNQSGHTTTHDSLLSSEYPDPYVVFATLPNPLFPGQGTFTRNDSGFVYQGIYVYDTTISAGFRKDIQHRDAHVTAILRPYQKEAAVRKFVNAIPARYDLSQNFPNPFNAATVIRYRLPVGSQVTLKVLDVLGREVATVVNERLEAGYHSVKFDGSRFSSGVYFYRLCSVGNDGRKFESLRKMALAK